MSPNQIAVPALPQPPARVTAHRDLAYVNSGHERQKLDLYLPDHGDNLPLLLWIHGGAFRLGSKAGNENDQLPFDYLTRGHKVAVRWLRAQATQYRLNSNCFLAWGPSAGGHYDRPCGWWHRRPGDGLLDHHAADAGLAGGGLSLSPQPSLSLVCGDGDNHAIGAADPLVRARSTYRRNLIVMNL